MGNNHSKQRRQPLRSSALPPRHAQHNAEDASPNDKPQSSPSTRPLYVPQYPYPEKQTDEFYPCQPDSGLPYGRPPSNFSRPPRLPLPVEEVHRPWSPVITPQDISSTIGLDDVGGLPRRASVLSSTTGDDEDVGTNVAFSEDQATIAPAIPTSIEWNRPGEEVYVTGTFVQWGRKLQLHRDEKGGFGTTLQLKPGMHQLKFLVDGDMITSDDLPTTVDYTNILVNYIEVVAPLPATAGKQPSAPAVPMSIPGAAMTHHAPGTAEFVARPLQTQTEMQAPEVEADSPPTKETMPAPEASGSLSISLTQTSRAPSPAQQHQLQQLQEPEQQELPRQRLPQVAFTKQIPQFLLDRYSNPEAARFQRSSCVVNMLPQPPPLPIFLGKSILNGITPHKDDASVLITPNHTMLNHFATSSIKDGVLATSCTTRYKRKVSLPTFPKTYLRQDC